MLKNSKKRKLIDTDKINVDFDFPDYDDFMAPDLLIKRNNNHVYFYDDVNKNNITKLLDLLEKTTKDLLIQQINYDNFEPVIMLHINSYGGVVYDALLAVDYIINSKIPIHTIIEGASASAATLMSVVGHKRFITKNAHFLIHQLSSSFWGKMAEIEDEKKNLDDLMEVIKNIYKEYTNISERKLDKCLKHDLWWNAKKCKKYGFVDEIM